MRTLKSLFACFFTLLLVGAGVAQAETRSEMYYENINQFVTMMDRQITGEQLNLLIQKLAVNKGITKEEALNNAMNEYKQSHDSSISQYDRSGGGDRSLPKARHRGDFFYSPVNFYGHCGIYSYKDRVVEAIGDGALATESYYNNVFVTANTEIRSVNTSQANKDKAADRARTYIGRGYNSSFFTSSKNDWGGLHCAQLVWASYYFGAGIDIDEGDDDIVWPIDLKNTSKATTYRRV